MYFILWLLVWFSPFSGYLYGFLINIVVISNQIDEFWYDGMKVKLRWVDNWYAASYQNDK